MTASTYARTTHTPARNRKDAEHRRITLARAGVPSLVSAVPVRKHLRELNKIGVSAAMVAWQIGLTATTVRDIRDGRTTHTRPRVAAAIMRANHIPHPRQQFVLPIGAVRRVHALQALGWPAATIADRVGIAHRDIRGLTDRRHIAYRKWAAIRDVYEELSGTPGPSMATIAKVATLGYLPPLEWEGVDIDDPRRAPQALKRPAGERFQAAVTEDVLERRRRVADLTRAGLSAPQIADRLGVSIRTVERDRATTQSHQ
ncbi:helix-turn-helix domain-containing protein [Rhodococcus sp. NPDC003348]